MKKFRIGSGLQNFHIRTSLVCYYACAWCSGGSGVSPWHWCVAWKLTVHCAVIDGFALYYLNIVIVIVGL